MRLLYQAKNHAEAHLILNLLEQAGLVGRIDGEYLQGGMGELQVSGNVRVMITEADYEKGKEIIRQWESNETIELKESSATKQPENKSKAPYLTIKWKYFIIITIASLGVFAIIYETNTGSFHNCFPGGRPVIKTNINKTTIIQVTKKIQNLLSIEFIKNNIQDTQLDQGGLVNGEEIGVALEHLIYMHDILNKINTDIPHEISTSIYQMEIELEKIKLISNK